MSLKSFVSIAFMTFGLAGCASPAPTPTPLPPTPIPVPPTSTPAPTATPVLPTATPIAPMTTSIPTSTTVPPTPTALVRPTITETNYSGFWTGTTSQGKKFELVIENDAVVSYYVEYDIPNCGLSTRASFNRRPQLTGNAFSIPTEITGTFTSAISASGTVSIACTGYYIPGSGGTLAWSANKSTQAPPATPVYREIPSDSILSPRDIPQGFTLISRNDLEVFNLVSFLDWTKISAPQLMSGGYMNSSGGEAVAYLLLYPLSPSDKATLETIFMKPDGSFGPGVEVIPGMDNFGDGSTGFTSAPGDFFLSRRGDVLEFIILLRSSSGTSPSLSISEWARIIDSRVATMPGLK